MSVSQSYSEFVSYSTSLIDLGSCTETTTVPYTYYRTAFYTYTGTTVPYTYSGTTVDYTYVGTTVAYTETATSTIQMLVHRHTNEPSPSPASSTSSLSPSTTSSSTMSYDLEPGDNQDTKDYPTPTLLKAAHSLPTSTSKAPTPTVKTKTCSATTTFPARSFLPAEESRGNRLVSGGQLSQLLQHLTLV